MDIGSTTQPLPPHGGNLRWAQERYGFEADNILDFSTNINPLGPPNGVYQTILENLKCIEHYPDPDCKYLGRALAHRLNIHAKGILVGNGVSELLYLACRSLKLKKVLIPTPSFSEYEKAALANDITREYIYLPAEDDFELPLAQILSNLDRVDALFLCNPNNPVGNVVSLELLHTITEKCRSTNTFLIIDESFLDFVRQNQTKSLIQDAMENRYLIVLYSLTKIYALPGLRLGCLIAKPETIAVMKKKLAPWTVNSLAQVAGLAALADLSFLERTREFVSKEKEYLYHALKRIKGVRPYYPQANFIMVDISLTGLDAFQVTEALGARGILVRNCSNFRGLGKTYLRVAVKKREDNQKLITALSAIVERRA